jgi:hypothetical protein
VRHNGRDQEVAFAVHLYPSPVWCEATRRVDRRALVAARGQPSGFPGGVHTTDLHLHRRDTGQAQHQHHDQRGDAQRRFHGARTGTAD